MIEKFKISYLLCILAVIALLAEILSFFYIGFTVVGLWSLSEYYIPLVIVLSLLEKFFNKNINKRYFVASLLLNVVYIIILAVQVTNFSY